MKSILRHISACVTIVVAFAIFGQPSSFAQTSANGVYFHQYTDPSPVVSRDPFTLITETYVTGSETTITTITHKPADIILVLDVSGSMNEKIENNTVTKLSALKSSVENFIDVVKEDADSFKVEHRISIIKFAGRLNNSYGNSTYWMISLYGTDFNYSQRLFTFQSVTSNYETMKTTVEDLTGCGATQSNYGLQLAQTEMSNARSNSSHIVILFTDGEPATSLSFSDFDSSVANSAISYSKTLKSAGAQVYTIGLYDSESDNQEKYMNYISSNYPSASSMTNSGSAAASNYKYMVTDSGSLSSIFESIANSVTTGGATTTLSTKTQVVQSMSGNFTYPEGTQTSDIKVYTANCTGASGNTLTFGSETEFTDAKVVINDAAKTVSVSNFAFSDNWCGQRGSGTYSGKKLIIKMPVQLTTDSEGGEMFVPDEGGTYIIDDNDQVVVKIDQGDTEPIVLPNITVKVNGLSAGETIVFAVTNVNDADNPYICGYLVLVGDADNSVVSATIHCLTAGQDYIISPTSWTCRSNISSIAQPISDLQTSQTFNFDLASYANPDNLVNKSVVNVLK